MSTVIREPQPEQRDQTVASSEGKATMSNSTLRTRALQGGAFVVLRQALGMVISMASVLFVTRVIGPTQYGIFASAFGIVGYIAGLGTWGIDVYLLRRAEEPLRRDYALGFTLLLCISAVFTTVLVVAHNRIGAAVRIPALGPMLLVLSPYIPLNLLALPAVVQLDRALRFRTVAVNELVSQVISVCVAVPLAMTGVGAWAPASGILAQQLCLLVMTYCTAGFRPSLTWNTREMREVLSYGLSYSSSIWVWQLRTLVNPILVARFAGVQAVGTVALAIRMAEVLAFAKNATWRIAMATLAKLGGRRDLLRRSIEEGMRLQVLAVGIPVAAFALMSRSIFLPVFGHRWDAALHVFPFVALAYLANALFNLHSSVLYLLRLNWQVTWLHILHVFLLVTTVALTAPHFGYMAYGYGELAAVIGYGLVHFFVMRAVGSPRYGGVSVWFGVVAIALACSSESMPIRLAAACVLLLPLLVPGERSVVRGYIRMTLSTGSTA